MNKHKAAIIPDRICKNNNNMFVTVTTINVCKMEPSGHLWLPFLGQQQPDAVLFAMIYFDF